MEKGKRILVAIGMALLASISWVVALSQKTDSQAQGELIAQAQAYLEDEVYVLAVPVLEEAVGYHADQSGEAEELLKAAYAQLLDQAGYAKKYTDLLDRQMGREGAPEEVFLESAQYYLANANVPKALEVLRDGLEKTGSEKLAAFYEENRYAYTTGYKVYEDVTEIYNGGIAVSMDGKWGLASKDGSLVLPCQYDKISNYYDSKAIVMVDGVISAVDMNGNRLALLHEKASDMAHYGDYAVMVKLQDGWHMADGAFQAILPEAYEDIRLVNNGCAAAKQGGKWGLADPKGQWLLEPQFEEIICDGLGRCYGMERLFIRKGSQAHLVKLSEGWIQEIGEAFEDAKPFLDSYAAVKKNGKWGFANEEGEVVIDCQFEDAKSFSGHLAAVKKDGKWGYANRKGSIVIPCSFEDAKSFCDGSAPVKTETGWGFITLEEYGKGGAP